MHLLKRNSDQMVVSPLNKATLRRGSMPHISVISTSNDMLTTQDIENKFTRLALSFKTDKLTLNSRLDLQKQQRDLTESNLDKEIRQLKNAIMNLTPLCVDGETTELLKSIRNQADILRQSCSKVSTAAETYGSVQQESRVAQSVELMVSNVEHIRKLYDKQALEIKELRKLLLEYDINPDDLDVADDNSHISRNLITHALNQRGRRASVASFQRAHVQEQTGRRSVTVEDLTHSTIETLRKKSIQIKLAKRASTSVKESDNEPEDLEEDKDDAEPSSKELTPRGDDHPLIPDVEKEELDEILPTSEDMMVESQPPVINQHHYRKRNNWRVVEEIFNTPWPWDTRQTIQALRYGMAALLLCLALFTLLSNFISPHQTMAASLTHDYSSFEDYLRRITSGKAHLRDSHVE